MDDQRAGGPPDGTPSEGPRRGGRSSTMGLLLTAAAVVVAVGAVIAGIQGDGMNALRALALAGVLALGGLDRLRWGGKGPVTVDVATLVLLAVFVALLFLGA